MMGATRDHTVERRERVSEETHLLRSSDRDDAWLGITFESPGTDSDSIFLDVGRPSSPWWC